MNVEIDGIDLIAAAQVAALVGGILVMLVVGLTLYLLVRPPRHVREAKKRPLELQEDEAEQLLDVMDRMERRLEVLERALEDQGQSAPRPAQRSILETADEGPESRREI